MDRAWLYQPLASADRLAVGLTVGGVESYLKAKRAVPLLPAASVQLPLTCAAALSGPL